MKVSAALSLLLPPCSVKNWLLKMFGWKIASGCRIGHSWIEAKHVNLGESARIGHGNYIKCEALVLHENAYINILNLVTGPFYVVLSSFAAIGNQNKISRAKKGIAWGKSILKLGTYSKITSNHVIDCTRPIKLGDYSTIAGRSTQIWTHGYMYAPSGLARFRIDGGVSIGNNVYIGSACVINAAVTISDSICVGSASCVSSSLEEPGLYVNQPLRKVPLHYSETLDRYAALDIEGLVETVVQKRPRMKH